MSLDVASLLANVASTWALVGLIWFVQVVHYPLFAGVGEDRFLDYHAQHSRRVTRVVMVLMPIEAVSAYALLWARPAGVPLALAIVGAVLVTLAAGVTAVVQVPQHGALGDGYDALVVRRLTSGNWVRTAIWTARGALVLVMLAAALDR